MKNMMLPYIFAVAGLLPQGNAAAQTFSNKLPVNNVNCAAVFTVPPTNKAINPDFETMRQYFYALAVATLGKQNAETQIAAAGKTISNFELLEKMTQARACGFKYIETNSFFNPAPKT